MYFKKLEMLGFKSFADKTVLNFEPGITAIVGPNGCGKSNIFDAIRWVLGEQSVKSLRGSSMEDVIFNGTDKKAGVGFAEVSLTFSNEKKILPIEYDEVTVTRRLFRSGESEYLLNKTQVRLKDILELFMGTGIGAESYSLIEQGKVDLLISSNPEDRRVILDEASGITKYKSKKREALNKLEDTENNLLRINDIIIEVKRQIGSIERQANKARRYKEEFEKLKDLEIKLAVSELDKLKSDKQTLREQLSASSEIEAKLNNQKEELNKNLSAYNSNLEKLRFELDELKAQDIKLESAVEMEKRHIELNKERIAEARERGAKLEEQKNQINQRCLIQNEKIEKLKLEIADLSKFEQGSLGLVKEKTQILEEIALTVKKAQDDIVKAKKGTLELTGKQSKIKNELTEIFSQIQQFLARKRRLELERTKVLSEKQDIQVSLEEVNQQIELLQSKLNTLNSEKKQTSDSLDNLRIKLKESNLKIIELEKEKVTLESQQEFIEDLKLQYQDMPSPVKGVFLTTEAPNANITGIIGKVREAVPFEDKYKIFIEAKYIELDSQKLEQRINEVISLIEKLKETERSLNSEIELKDKAIKDLEASVHQEEIAFSNQEMQKNNILEQVNKFDSELELISEELKEAGVSLDKLNIKDVEIKKENEEVDEQFRQIQNSINANSELISLKLKLREETSVSLAQIETEVASLKERENSLVESLKTWQDAYERDCQELSNSQKETEALILKSQELEKQNIELENKISEFSKNKQELSLKFTESEKKIADVLKVTKEEQERSSSLDSELQKIVKGSHDIEMQEQELLFKEQSIKERFVQSYKVNLEELKDISLEGIDFELLSNQVLELKIKVESFGTVNLVAIEEYEELKKRFEFLNQQQQDLLSAKEQLHSTINKINRTTRQLFLDTFNKVAEEFKTYFKLLFGGGEAQLILMNPDDVLETGIEIIARPPGKKLQSISLLSGGEKALTAVALIFGVFKVNPCPFCILDEIDAPLDESNVGRFGYILKDFAKQSQFIVITHNKKTIVNASVMYGITMQETGVSRIVSVKFADRAEEKVGVEKKEEVAVPVA